MKTAIQPFSPTPSIAIGSAWGHPVETTPVHARKCSAPPCRPEAMNGTRGAMSVVLVLAFCQSLLFIVIWLFVCSSAGAADASTAGFNPALKISEFNPRVDRDPFVVRVPVKQPVQGEESSQNPVQPLMAPPPPAKVMVTFHLQGTLFQQANPTAIVNGELVTLNKFVTLTAGPRTVRAKPIEITRERVVLQIGDQTVELRMGQAETTAELPVSALQ